MHLLLLGISHRTAPVELRERLDFQAPGLPVGGAGAGGARLDSRGGRRFDVQSGGALRRVRRSRRGAADLLDFISEFHSVDRSVVQPHLYDRVDLEAARHLFRVAAGLDSLVVGEPQILGQVKDAHTAAAEIHASGAILNRLFHGSFAAGKRVRTETGLGSGAVSVSFAAVSLAKKIFGA